jgi:hypothetical protein
LREEEVPKEFAAVTQHLQNWSEEYYAEEARAICSFGKYRLAPGYEHFHVNPEMEQVGSREKVTAFTVF